MNTSQFSYNPSEKGDTATRLTSRLIPRTANLDEESLLFVRDARQSQLTHKKQYMTSLVSGTRIRAQPSTDAPSNSANESKYVLPTITDNHLPMRQSPNSKTLGHASQSRPQSPVPTSMSAHPPPSRSQARVPSGTHTPSTTLGLKSLRQGIPPADQRRRHSPGTSVSAPSSENPSPVTARAAVPGVRRASNPNVITSPATFTKAMWDIVFRKFCQEEVIYADLKNQLLSRVQKNAHVNHPDYLASVFTMVVRATRNVS
ncbi:hypothetical protein BJ085DRAFT_40308 [Dimargaris cristalligena]|uniref:Uncharacterized protein n=1 Tax=Dimargaris cristalligena TaxID=215637 RepID=A0A4V1J4Y0_9FUNG|nr:hypothetical protein BJ085DRAFT_40308 [Dimargaris cristalligena]|eukprot:RKP37129.1 hypothetical protein BJ085DRAFT_40308 [Dimargaris cristalligena]